MDEQSVDRGPSPGRSQEPGDGNGQPETFAEVFREALAARRMSITTLRQRLLDHGVAVSLASLSYWRSASRQPDREAQRDTIAMVEEILGLPSSRLAALAGRSYRSPKLGAPGLRYPLAGDGRSLASALEYVHRALNAPPNEWLREVSTQQILDIGLDGWAVRSTAEAVIECVEGRITHLGFGTTSLDGGMDLFRITVLDGGQIVDRVISPDGEAQGVLIRLDTPIDVGETAMLTVRIDLPPMMRGEQGVSSGVNRPAKKVVNWVRFHPDAVPDWVEEVEVTPEGEHRRFRGLDTPTSVHQARWDWGPGSITLNWGYGDPER